MKSQTFSIAEINDSSLQKIAEQIKEGAIAIIPTDTIYGIVGLAKNQKTVERIYRLRKRTSTKPMIILISGVDQILDLGVKITLKQQSILKKLWPNQISVVVDCDLKTLQYLHRGKKSLAFRFPNNDFLIRLLNITGPIVAPSANFEGEKPASDIEDAKKYFGDSSELYIDAGKIDSPPSTVVKLEKLKLTILREGAAKIPTELLK